MNEYDENEYTERKSKSQLKREMLELQALGEALCALSTEIIKRLPIPEDIRAAALESKSVTKHEARRRHMQYMGRLVRESKQLDELREVMNRLDDKHSGENQKFKRIEKWRDRLVAGEMDLIEEILAEYPNADRQRLRQLARNAASEIKKNKPPKSSRELFRTLRKITQQ